MTRPRIEPRSLGALANTLIMDNSLSIFYCLCRKFKSFSLDLVEIQFFLYKIKVCVISTCL